MVGEEKLNLGNTTGNDFLDWYAESAFLNGDQYRNKPAGLSREMAFATASDSAGFDRAEMVDPTSNDTIKTKTIGAKLPKTERIVFGYGRV